MIKVETYKTLTFEEDARLANPAAYSRNGNRKCQHAIITKKEEVDTFLSFCGLDATLDDAVIISILWHLPSRELCTREEMWVCLSGYTFNSRVDSAFRPTHFVISDNTTDDEAQEKALAVIDLLNSLSYINVGYENFVHCNACGAEFPEKKLIYDGEEDMNFCPSCGEGGCFSDC